MAIGAAGGLRDWQLTRSSLFMSCALVQAVPAAVDLLRSLVQREVPDLAYLAYGTFAAWFVFMACAAACTTETARSTP